MSQQQDIKPLDRIECLHCGLWFKIEDAKPARDPKKLKCPYCDWTIEKEL